MCVTYMHVFMCAHVHTFVFSDKNLGCSSSENNHICFFKTGSPWPGARQLQSCAHSSLPLYLPQALSLRLESPRQLRRPPPRCAYCCALLHEGAEEVLGSTLRSSCLSTAHNSSHLDNGLHL